MAPVAADVGQGDAFAGRGRGAAFSCMEYAPVAEGADNFSCDFLERFGFIQKIDVNGPRNMRDWAGRDRAFIQERLTNA